MRPRAVRAGATQSNGNQSNVACWFQQLQGVGPGCWSLKVTGAFPRASSRCVAELVAPTSLVCCVGGLVRLKCLGLSVSLQSVNQSVSQSVK